MMRIGQRLFSSCQLMQTSLRFRAFVTDLALLGHDSSTPSSACRGASPPNPPAYFTQCLILLQPGQRTGHTTLTLLMLCVQGSFSPQHSRCSCCEISSLSYTEHTTLTLQVWSHVASVVCSVACSFSYFLQVTVTCPQVKKNITIFYT
jgi:hypothetical protein